jgi:hypothetical protein
MPTFRPILRYPEANGHRLSRTSVELRFAPNLVGGNGPPLILSCWKTVNMNNKLTPGTTWGNKAKKMGRTRGKYEPTADLEVYVEDMEILRVALAAAGASLNMGYMEVSFDLFLTGFEQILGGAFLWEALGCRITEESLAIPDSDDQLFVKLTLDPMDCRKNGLQAVFESTATGLPG